MPTALRAAIAVFAVTLVACGNAGGGESTGASSMADTKECPAEAGAPMLEGVDVSDGQGKVDWAVARQDGGIAWVIMKATQGTYDVQTDFAANWAAAKDAGVARGAYCFFDPTEDGASQAQKFLATMGPLDAEDLSPMLDVECPDDDATCLGFSGGSGDADAGDLRARVDAWMAAVEAATGRKPILYTFVSYFAGDRIDAGGLDAYPLWIANYTTSCYDAPSPWTRAAIWQYSGTGSAAGISGEVDRDRMVEPIDELRGWPRAKRAAPADVDGDGKADFCGRSSDGVTCALAASSYATPIAGPAWTDAVGWRDAAYTSTVQLGDVDGDGKSDVCARAAAGLTCAISRGASFAKAFAGPAWSDATGWNAPEYYATIQLADVDGDGKMNACARGSAGITCARSNGATFAAEFAGPAWSDAAGWNVASRYATIRFGDVDGDGKDDVCGRASDGLRCALSTGAGFGGEFVGPAWSDAEGWGAAAYAATIALTDVDGDGKMDACARGAEGIECAISNGHGFGATYAGPAWSDADGWNLVDRYASIVFLDLDGDGKSDVCGKGADGVRCALSTGASFGADVAGPAWSDATRWNEPHYALTISPADVNGDGKGDLCARGASGVTCAPWTGAGFGAAIAGPAWSDGAGWSVAPYWGTVRVAGTSKRAGVAVDGGPVFADDAGVVSASFDASTQTSAGCSCRQAPGDRGARGASLGLAAFALFLARRARSKKRPCSSTS